MSMEWHEFESENQFKWTVETHYYTFYVAELEIENC